MGWRDRIDKSFANKKDIANRGKNVKSDKNNNKKGSQVIFNGYSHYSQYSQNPVKERAGVGSQKEPEKTPAGFFPDTFIVADDLEPHNVTGIVPEFEGPGFEAFKKDIEAKGLLEPIVLFQGKILDGRARYRACKELGLPVIARKWEGGMDPTCYISAVNRLRTHKPDPAAIPDPEPAGMGAEYHRIWNQAWTLADYIDDPDGAPLAERKAKLNELNELRERMAKIEQQGGA
jgi:hypothetical protein